MKSTSIRSEKLQNESFPNFSNFRPEFCPEFCSEFFPNFSRTFRASFRGRRRPEKIHQKSQPFFNVKFPGKHEKNIHKILLESRQSNTCIRFGQVLCQDSFFQIEDVCEPGPLQRQSCDPPDPLLAQSPKSGKSGNSIFRVQEYPFFTLVLGPI